MENDTNLQGNISTIIVFIYTILAPYIAQYISQEVFLSIFGLIITIWSAYHPNTLQIFNNTTENKENNTDTDDTQ